MSAGSWTNCSRRRSFSSRRRGLAEEPLAPSISSVYADHLGVGARLIDEHQLGWVKACQVKENFCLDTYLTSALPALHIDQKDFVLIN